MAHPTVIERVDHHAFQLVEEITKVGEPSDRKPDRYGNRGSEDDVHPDQGEQPLPVKSRRQNVAQSRDRYAANLRVFSPAEVLNR